MTRTHPEIAKDLCALPFAQQQDDETLRARLEQSFPQSFPSIRPLRVSPPVPPEKWVLEPVRADAARVIHPPPPPVQRSAPPTPVHSSEVSEEEAGHGNTTTNMNDFVLVMYSDEDDGTVLDPSHPLPRPAPASATVAPSAPGPALRKRARTPTPKKDQDEVEPLSKKPRRVCICKRCGATYRPAPQYRSEHCHACNAELVRDRKRRKGQKQKKKKEHETQAPG